MSFRLVIPPLHTFQLATPFFLTALFKYDTKELHCVFLLHFMPSFTNEEMERVAARHPFHGLQQQSGSLQLGSQWPGVWIGRETLSKPFWHQQKLVIKTKLSLDPKRHSLRQWKHNAPGSGYPAVTWVCSKTSSHAMTFLNLIFFHKHVCIVIIAYKPL